MKTLFKNTFVQSVGVATTVYLLFQAFAWGFEAILGLLESFSRWYRYSGIEWAEEAAIAIGVTYLIIAAVINSRHD